LARGGLGGALLSSRSSQAESADNEWVRESWLRLAEDWTKLAKSVEAEEAQLGHRNAKGEWMRAPPPSGAEEALAV
jgi:hypothetical protein